MTVTNEMIDSLLADYKKPEDLIGENGLLKLLKSRDVQLKKIGRDSCKNPQKQT